MSSPDKKNRLLMLAPLALAVFAPLLYQGCAKGISGNAYQNSAPQVRFVNVPPDSASFSANPIISWVGTDVDGRVVEYRYVVILQSEIDTAVGAGADASALVSYALSQADRWKAITVTLDDPGNKDTVRLSADFNDPVNKHVSQYVFLAAYDDDGTRSDVVFRVFFRNDHFPQTTLTPFLGPYVNIDAQRFGLGGIPASWFGEDPIDFPSADDPPVEYDWRLFGPYTSAESTMIVDNFTKVVLVAPDRTYELGDTLVDTLFDFTRADTTIDSTVSPPDTTITVAVDSIFVIPVDTANADQLSDRNSVFDTILVLDSLAALDSALEANTPATNVNRLVRSSFNPLTGDMWVANRSELFFKVFDTDPLVDAQIVGDTTRENTFVFWVRARDDAFVPDPTPAFGLFNVIEARHERDVMVIDMAKLGSNFNINGIWTPCERALANLAPAVDTVKNRFARFIDGWIPNTSGPDNNSGFDIGTFDPCGDDFGFVPPGKLCDDIFIEPAGSSPDYMLGAGLPQGNPFVPRLRDILKHKVIVITKDHVQSALPFKGDAPAARWIVEGALSGVNFWVMSRAPFQRRAFNSLEPYCYAIALQEIPQIYANVFGLLGGCYQSWYGMAVQRKLDQPTNPEIPDPVRNEDFIGAVPTERFSGIFPTIDVDCNLLKNAIRWADRSDCRFVLPNIQYPFMDSICALPEVGYTIPNTSAGTEAIYLYRSRFGEAKYPFWDLDIDDYQGTVVAVRRDANIQRTSHWQFTQNAMDSASFQVAFNNMMDWLFAEPWGGPSFGSTPARTPAVNGDYSADLARYSQILEEQRQRKLAEILPPGQTRVKNQFEFEKHLKRWRIEQRAIQQAELNGEY